MIIVELTGDGDVKPFRVVSCSLMAEVENEVDRVFIRWLGKVPRGGMVKNVYFGEACKHVR